MSLIVILIGSTPASEQAVKAALKQRADLVIEPQTANVVAAVTAAAAKIAIVDLSRDADAGLRALEEMREISSTVQLVAVAPSKDSDLILRAVRAGAREFLSLDDQKECTRILSELVRRSGAEQQIGTIVSVFPSKGGVGSTTIATNAAGAVAAAGKSVLLVDLDVQLGDALVFLDTSSKYTLADVLANLKRLDRELLLSSLTKHKSGMWVLAQSDRLKDADKVDPARMPEVLRFLARCFDYVFCDGLRGFTEMSLAALDTSGRRILVLNQEVPSIKNCRRCLDIFGKLGYEPEKTMLVVNRYDKAEIDLPTIAYNLGVEVGWTIANDYTTVMRAINRGLLLNEAAPRAKVTDDIRRLVSEFTGDQGGETGSEQKSGGFFRGLFGASGNKSGKAADTKSGKPALSEG